MSFGALAFALALLGFIVIAVRFRDARNQELVEDAMEAVFGEDGQATFDEIALIVRENKHVLATYHDEARELSRTGRAQQAAEWMAHGCEAIEELAPDYFKALQVLTRLTRALSAVIPLAPVRVYAFDAWRLRGLAGGALVLHHVLVTGRERMLLRLRLLGTAFRWALRWLRRSTERLPARPAEWQAIDALVHDLNAMGDETVVTAERVLRTLDALDRLRDQLRTRRQR